MRTLVIPLVPLWFLSIVLAGPVVSGCSVAVRCTDDDECTVGNVCKDGDCVEIAAGEGEGEEGEGEAGEGEAGEGEGEEGEGEGEGGEGEGEGPIPGADDIFVQARMGNSVDVPLSFSGVSDEEIVDVVVTAPAVVGCSATPVAGALPRIARVSCGAQELGDVAFTYRAQLAAGIAPGDVSSPGVATVRYLPSDWSDLSRRQRVRVSFDVAALADTGINLDDVEGHAMFLRSDTLPAGALIDPVLFRDDVAAAIDVDGTAGVFVPAPGTDNVLLLYFDVLAGAAGLPALPDPFAPYQGVWHLDTFDDAAVFGPDDENPLGVFTNASEPSPIDGLFGGARSFTGDTRLAVLDPTELALDGSEGTMSMWLRSPNGLSSDERIGIYAAGDPANDGDTSDGFGPQDLELHVGLHSDEAAVNGFAIGSDLAQINALSGDMFAADDEWTFLAMTWAGGAITLHSNGDAENFSNPNGNVTLAQVLDDAVLIGGPVDLTQRSIRGDVDEVRVSTTALSRDRLAFEYFSAIERMHHAHTPPTDFYVTTVTSSAASVNAPLLRVPSEVSVLVARAPSNAVVFAGTLGTLLLQQGDGASTGDVLLELYTTRFLTQPPASFDELDVVAEDDVVVIVWQSPGLPSISTAVTSAVNGVGSFLLAGTPAATTFDIAGSWYIAATVAGAQTSGSTFTPVGIAPPLVPLDADGSRPFDVDVRLIFPDRTLTSVQVNAATDTAAMLIWSGF